MHIASFLVSVCVYMTRCIEAPQYVSCVTGWGFDLVSEKNQQKTLQVLLYLWETYKSLSHSLFYPLKVKSKDLDGENEGWWGFAHDLKKKKQQAPY